MTLNLHLPNQMEELKPSITVVGVGGAGGNAVNNMIAAQLEGVNFVVANTDAQALNNSLATSGIQLGKGLGAGGNPKVAHDAAEEAAEQLSAYMDGSHMVFITAGMGGGTGTGAAPVVAKLAKEQGILTVAVVTKPFQFEGTHRMRVAEAGLKELQEYVDTLIIIPNQNLFRIANERTTFADAFKMADEVLHSGVRGVTDLIVKPGLINLDFADIRSVMREMGKAMMGTGEATGERRAIEAAEAAISNPLLDDVSLKGAKALLINITGGPDMTLFEVDEAANRVRSEVDPDANIIFGSTFNDVMEGKIRVSVVATGIDSQNAQASRPNAQATEPKKNVMFNMPRPEPIKAPARPTFETARGSFLTDAALGRPTAPKFEPEVTAAAAAPRPALVVHEEPAPQPQPQPQYQQQASVKTPMAEYKIEEFVMADEAPAISPRRDAQAAQQVATEEGAPRFGLFARLADAGKAALARNEAQAAAKAEAPAQPERSLHVTEKPRPEAKRTAPMADEEQYLDIPAFLRRQAN